MKKIVALVLSLVMVLGLATTAFAAADKYDGYVANADNYAAGKLTAVATTTNGLDGVEITYKAAVKNSDGSGNLEYYEISGVPYVKTAAPTVESLAITADGKTDILFFLDKVASWNDVKYVAEAKAFADFGTKCGQLYQVNTLATYYEVTKTSAASPVKGDVYAAAAVGATAYNSVLVGDKIVKLVLAPVTEADTLGVDQILTHKWAVTGVQAVSTITVPTQVTCLNCGAVVTTLYKSSALVPAGEEFVSVPGDYGTAGWVFVEPAAAATTTPVVDGEKVESAETFDAGIAMYVGMSVMAAAGSAVVLKKKD